MSGHHVGDLASSFVEMAKAYEELPKVREALEIERAMSDEKSQRIQSLELRIIDYKNVADQLRSEIRTLEVARDDAELRFLEADDKLNRVAGALQTAGETVGLALRRPEPVKVEEPQAEPSAEPGQSAVDPIVQSDSITSTTASSETAATAETASQEQPAYNEVPPEPFSPESKPTDLVEVREELPTTSAGVALTADTHSTATMPETVASQETVPTAAGQSDPLPTAALPIAESPAGSTNANPSVDASSQTDEIDSVSYANEPQDKWTVAWSEWAVKMDRKYGRYNWPMRTARA